MVLAFLDKKLFDLTPVWISSAYAFEESCVSVLTAERSLWFENFIFYIVLTIDVCWIMFEYCLPEPA